MRTIKLYKASNFKYTPFDDFVKGDMKYLNVNNICIVNNINDADIIISQNFKHIKSHLWRYFLGKKFLIWTLEPRFNTDLQPFKALFFGLINYQVMNIYTGNVFVSNLTFHAGSINKKLKKLPDNYKLKGKKIVALMSYYKGVKSEPLIINGGNRDLIGLRSKIALHGCETNLLDVFGKGWPSNISREDSREGNWVKRKKELMKDYNFNLCFENTATFNYMTEKIWDSIENYCLPIYYGKHTNAYELFPKNSFIDYSLFSNPSQLFEFIEEMNDKEFVERINKCIGVYNMISKKGGGFAKCEREKMLAEIVRKIHITFRSI